MKLRVLPIVAGSLAVMAGLRSDPLLAQVDLLWQQPAASRPLAQVDEAELLLLRSDSVQASVYAAGLLSHACGVLDTPTVRRRGTTFTVLVAESRASADRPCMSLAPTRAFDISIPLDLGGLRAGRYRVEVNDLILNFVLDEDQP